MQCPVRNAGGDQGARNLPGVKGPAGIKAARKDFWEELCLCGHGASVCVPGPTGELSRVFLL